MQTYQEDVRQGQFPAEEHSIFMKEEEWETLLEELDGNQNV